MALRHRLPWAAALACLLASGAAAAIEPMGSCRVKLRSGRFVDASSLQPVDAAGAFWRVELSSGGAIVLPVRELKNAEPLAEPPPPADTISVALPPEDLDVGGCDPLEDGQLTRWTEMASRTARRHGLDAALVRAVIAVESCGNPRAVSKKGAIGLMQLMPKTAMDYGCTDPRDPEANLDAGCRHLARLMGKLGDLELAIAAYNAGEGAVERAGGIPKYRETQAYVKDVVRRLAILKREPEPRL